MKSDFDTDANKRNLQKLSLAYIDVQEEIEFW
jgi:hypothetical protein